MLGITSQDKVCCLLDWLVYLENADMVLGTEREWQTSG